MRMFKSIILSWDLWIAVVTAALAFALLPDPIPNGLAHDIYGTGISVLSIIFSVYFAALAIIISSSDDDFVRYLVASNHYPLLIAAFRWTLVLLFVALVYSIGLYIVTSALITSGRPAQVLWLFAAFCFLFSYSLLATFQSTLNALKYSHYRAAFVGLNK